MSDVQLETTKRLVLVLQARKQAKLELAYFQQKLGLCEEREALMNSEALKLVKHLQERVLTAHEPAPKKPKAKRISARYRKSG